MPEGIACRRSCASHGGVAPDVAAFMWRIPWRSYCNMTACSRWSPPACATGACVTWTRHTACTRAVRFGRHCVKTVRVSAHMLGCLLRAMEPALATWRVSSNSGTKFVKRLGAPSGKRTRSGPLRPKTSIADSLSAVARGNAPAPDPPEFTCPHCLSPWRNFFP